MEVAPKLLLEVISVTLAIWANSRSSGVATVEAMVSGLAPGKDADTLIVGKSMAGRVETGKNPTATKPERTIPTVKRVVAIGLLINGVEMLMLFGFSPVS
jgi:hypothetical protein